MKVALLPCLLLSVLVSSWPSLPVVVTAGQEGSKAARKASESSAIERLSWLSGRWVADGRGQYLEETWSPAREDAMVGCFRWARQGGVWMYELMSIEVDEEHGLVFRLRHFNRGLEPWESEKDGAMTYPLLEAAGKRVVFENPARSEPRRFVYEREGDVLTITLQGPGEENGGQAFKLKLDE